MNGFRIDYLSFWCARNESASISVTINGQLQRTQWENKATRKKRANKWAREQLKKYSSTFWHMAASALSPVSLKTHFSIDEFYFRFSDMTTESDNFKITARIHSEWREKKRNAGYE